MNYYMTFYLFFLALVVGLDFAQNASLADSHCHSDWIQNEDLHPSCVCEIGSNGNCDTRSLRTCDNRSLVSASKLVPKTEGCTEDNCDCDSCYLWFHSVCTCLKTKGLCDTSPSGSFIRLTDGKITSKKRMPGILQLQSDEPWEWGQTLADWQDKNHALVINSEKARKQEKIHMDVCPVFAGSTNPPRRPVQDILSDLMRSDYTLLKAVPGRDWLCKVEPTKYGHLKGVTSEIQSKTASLPDGCKYLVGAAVVVDKRDYTWLCLTTTSESTQGQFRV